MIEVNNATDDAKDDALALPFDRSQMTERAIPLSVFGQVTSNIEWREQMDLKEAIYRRRAVRNFTAESIDKKNAAATHRRRHSDAQRSQSATMVIFGRA